MTYLTVYRGLIPAEDAPDIIANTFLAQLSDDTLTQIRYGFLDHRERQFVFLLLNTIVPIYPSLS